MAFLLAHLSDAHIGPIPRPRLEELLGKRLTGYANWLTKRSRQHDMAVLRALTADLLAQQPDHIVMTGDIVNIGLEAELAAARDWLATLGTPQDVSYTPGNHDAYVGAAMPVIDELYAPWTRGDVRIENAPRFPYVRRRAGVALIGLSSGIPTAPFIASGRLGPVQIAELCHVLEATKAEGLARVVFLHHPPHVGGARLFRGLEDAAEFEATIRRFGADLVLHGHNHRTSLHHIEGPDGPVPVHGAASASARPGGHYPGAAYNLFRIERQDAGLTVEARARGIGGDGEKLVELAS